MLYDRIMIIMRWLPDFMRTHTKIFSLLSLWSRALTRVKKTRIRSREGAVRSETAGFEAGYLNATPPTFLLRPAR